MTKKPIRKCKHDIYITKCSTCQKQEKFESNLADARSEVTLCLGEPTYHFLVGEKALYGHNELIIEEKLDNGTVYVGKDISGDLMAEPWFRLARVNVEKKPMVTKWPIQINYLQQSIDALYSYFYHFRLDMNTDYQRGNVWNEQDEVSLINSIFNEIEIGKFCIIRRDYSFDGPLYEVLDGKQRITAIIRFIESRFKYKGKFFYQLHPYDRHHFDSFPIVVGVTQQLSQKQKYEYFLRLNTTGKPQDISHLNYVESLLRGLKCEK
jgi:hypothetical protein